MTEKTSSGCAVGCLALLAIGVGSLIFGFDIVGKACVAAAMIITLVGALRYGDYGGLKVRRDREPRAFWLLTAIAAVLAAGAIMLVVDEIRGDLPAVAVDLPNEVDRAEVEFDARVRVRYPVGTVQAVILRDLREQGFSVRHEGRVWFGELRRDGIPCRAIWSVRWTERAGHVESLRGVYGLQCL